VAVEVAEGAALHAGNILTAAATFESGNRCADLRTRVYCLGLGLGVECVGFRIEVT